MRSSLPAAADATLDTVVGVRWLLAASLVVLAFSGCGGGKHSAPPAATIPAAPAAKPPAVTHPLHAVRVAVLDGDTGEAISNARISAPGAKERGLTLLTRPRTHSLFVTAAAPRYTTRTLELDPATGSATIHLYRPDGQWPMYGAVPTRTQFQPAIRLRPPFHVVWSKYLRGLIEFPAVISDGTAYVSNAGGRLFALSMRDGHTQWELDMKTHDEAASPAVSGDTLVAHAKSGRVLVVDRERGKVLWSYPVSGEIESSPVVEAGVDYLGDWAGEVYALDLRTHRPRWVYHDGCKITASAAISGGTVFLGDYCGRVIALSKRTGKLLWSASAGSPVYGTAAVANGRVYVPSRDAGALYAFTTTGRYLWHVPTGNLVYSAPAVWHGRVYFGSYSGTLYCVSAASGSVLWTLYAGGHISGAPTVIAGVVYTGSFAHRITGADARTGRQLFSFPHGEYVAVSGNRGKLLLYGWASLWAVEPRG
jgi:outer membrane protein assembly factor BamB